MIFFFLNPIKKSLTSAIQSKFTLIGHRIQPIKLLGPSPCTLKPRNTSIKPINNKTYCKLHYHICLHKQERIPSKIKLKALKPSLTIPRQVPLPKWEPNKHTRNSQDYNTTKAFNFPSANNVHLPTYYKACHYQSMMKLAKVKHLSKKAHMNLQAKPHHKCLE